MCRGIASESCPLARGWHAACPLGSMSEFKFACPVCGQHIKCDSDKSGQQVDCPTCFQKLIVPEPPQNDISKFILNAALAHAPRHVRNDTTVLAPIISRSRSGRFPLAITTILICAAAGTLLAFRGKISQEPSEPLTGGTSKNAAVNDTNWKLDLADVTIPDTPIAGRIAGRAFDPPRITLQRNTLIFRQSSNRPSDLGLMIMLYVKEGRELAGKSINVTTNSDPAPKVLLRWKDERGQPASQYYHRGYALRLDFDPLNGNHLTGKVYFCAPDEANTYVAGKFDAEILAPSKSKWHRKQKPMR
jgi:DNA-directed RNA polymerase subunit RPC12/RpoP